MIRHKIQSAKLSFAVGLIMIFSGFFSTSCAQIITTIAGNGTLGYTGDAGPATIAEIGPSWFSIDRYGMFYFSDYVGNSVRSINSYGIINTVYGNGSAGYSGDGGPATAASMNRPAGIAFDNAGNVYIADKNNHCIRKVDAGGIITTFAGTGFAGYTGDGGQATMAQLKSPEGVALDPAGNVYIADDFTNTIRKVNTSGIITTVAGNGTPGFVGDGGMATAALLNNPCGIILDTAGNIYCADYLNHRIRKINTLGVITTIAGSGPTGTGAGGYSGDGGPATLALLKRPNALSIDKAGNIYISDANNNRIRKIYADGTITTIAGTGLAAFGGDGGPAIAAKINSPNSVVLDCAGNIYIDDGGNARVRIITYDHPPSFTGGLSQSLVVCKNSTANLLDSLMAVTDADTGQTLTWSIVMAPVHGTAACAYSALSTGIVVNSTGISYTPTTGYAGSDSFKVQISDCSNSVGVATIYVTVNNCVLTSLWNTSADMQVHISPNPANDELTIIVGNDKYSSYSISNTLGQVLISQQLNAAQTKVNVKSLPAGLYYLMVRGESGVKVVKFEKL